MGVLLVNEFPAECYGLRGGVLFSDSSTPAREASPPTTCTVVLTVAVGSCPVKMATLAARAAEMEAVSGVPLPSLRVLQAAGAIRSEKVPKDYGGFRRMWSDREALKAAVGAALGAVNEFLTGVVAKKRGDLLAQPVP